MTNLPNSLDALRGLKAARWIRESGIGQMDNQGPEAQRHQQDVAIARYGLIDTGRVWSVAASGLTIGQHEDFQEMLAVAGAEYQILLVGYVSRFSRSLDTAVSARRTMHEAGAAILFCDNRILSSDPQEWERWANRSFQSEVYSRKLSRRITEGHESRWRRWNDPAGNPRLGFRRNPDNKYRIEINPNTISDAVRLFTRYAEEDISYTDLAASENRKEAAVREILSDPIYTGIVQYKGNTAEAAWRADPPVSDALFATVQDKVASRRRGGRPAQSDHQACLRSCDVPTAAEPSSAMAPMAAAGSEPSTAAEGTVHTAYQSLYDAPVRAMLEGLRLDPATVARVVQRALTPPDQQPDTTLLRRNLANQFAFGQISDEDFANRLQRSTRTSRCRHPRLPRLGRSSRPWKTSPFPGGWPRLRLKHAWWPLRSLG